MSLVMSDRIAVRPRSSDLAAWRGEDLLLLKVLENIGTFDGVTDSEMQRLGSYLDTTPLVVEPRTQDEDLKPSVVYFRHSMPVLDPNTAMDPLAEEVPPLIYAAPDGLYVSLDGDVLAGKRQERGWSPGQLVTEFGVSRYAVSKYESGINANIEMAIHLEELFDNPFLNPVNVFTGAEDVRDIEPTPDNPDVDPNGERVLSVLTRTGFTAHPTVHAPFKAVGGDVRRKKETNVFTGHSPLTRGAEKRIQIMSSLGEVTRMCSVYFVEEQQKCEPVDSTGVISCEELVAIDDPDEIYDLIRERTRDPVES